MQNGGEGGTTRTLFLDRDPETFRDICRHLQGVYRPVVVLYPTLIIFRVCYPATRRGPLCPIIRW